MATITTEIVLEAIDNKREYLRTVLSEIDNQEDTQENRNRYKFWKKELDKITEARRLINSVGINYDVPDTML